MPKLDFMHPTRKLLLDTAAQLLEAHSPDEVTGQMLLRASGVSHGSLYHHFDDASEVIETVLLDRFFVRAMHDADFMAQSLAGTPDKKTWTETMSAFTRAVHAPANRIFRMRRIQLLAYASSRPRMLERLTQQQGQLTASFIAIFTSVQQRGWIGPDADPHALAVLTQGIILGRIIDDVSTEQVNPEQWYALLDMILTKIFEA